MGLYPITNKRKKARFSWWALKYTTFFNYIYNPLKFFRGKN